MLPSFFAILAQSLPYLSKYFKKRLYSPDMKLGLVPDKIWIALSS